MVESTWRLSVGRPAEPNPTLPPDPGAAGGTRSKVPSAGGAYWFSASSASSSSSIGVGSSISSKRVVSMTPFLWLNS